MRKLLSVLAAPLLALALGGLLAGCSDSGHHTRKLHVKKENVTLHQLKPGNSHTATYAYQDDAGFWWYYIILTQQMNQTTSSPSSSYSYPSSSGAGRVSLPPGGTWSKAANDKGPQEEEIEPGQDQEITVSETDETGPLTEAQETAAEQSTDGMITEETTDTDTGTGVEPGDNPDTGGTDTGGTDTGIPDTGGDTGGGFDGGGDTGGGFDGGGGFE